MANEIAGKEYEKFKAKEQALEQTESLKALEADLKNWMLGKRGNEQSKAGYSFRLFRLYLQRQIKQTDMNYLEDLKRPTKQEQQIAQKSYDALSATLEQLKSKDPEIEIEETKEKIKIPLSALKLLAKILKVTSQGNPISIIPIATEMTTQAAAEFLGCSRPHLVKLLEDGEIPFTKVGKHRRVKFEDLADYKKKKREEREALLVEIMKGDEELGLYDSQR